MRSSSSDAKGLGLGFGRKPLFCLALSALTGAALAWRFLPEGRGGLILCAFAAALLLLCAVIPKARLLSGCLAIACLAGGWTALRRPDWNAEPYLGREVVLRAQVERVGREDGRAALILSQLRIGEDRESLAPDSGKVKVLIADAARNYAPGDIVYVTGRAERPMTPQYLTLSDDRALAWSQGVRFLVRATDEAVLFAGHGRLPGFSGWLSRLRQTIAERMEEAFTPDSAGLAKALLLGDSAALASSERRAFSALGLAHILAISGLHVSLMLAMLDRFAALLRLPRPLYRTLRAALLGGYILLADFRLSLLRVVWMLVVRDGAERSLRRYDPVSALSAAFLFQMLLTPWAFLQMGFQMSYLATLAVLLFQPLTRLLERRFRLSWAMPAMMTLAVTLVTWPYMLVTFGTFSPWAILSNLVFTAILPLVLGALLLWLILLPLGPGVLTLAAEWLCQILLSGVRIFGGEAEVLRASLPFSFFLLPYALGILGLAPVFLPPKGKKARVAIALTLCLVSAVGLFLPLRAREGVSVWSDGANCALLIVSEEETVLCVEGPTAGLSRALAARGVSRLDRLIVTRTGREKVAANLAPLLPGKIEGPGDGHGGVIPVQTLSHWTGKGETLEISWRERTIRFGGNENEVTITKNGRAVRISGRPWNTGADHECAALGAYEEAG